MEETVEIPKKIFDAIIFMVNDTPNRRLDYLGFKDSYVLAAAKNNEAEM